jgi:hypothetical protein
MATQGRFAAALVLLAGMSSGAHASEGPVLLHTGSAHLSASGGAAVGTFEVPEAGLVTVRLSTDVPSLLALAVTRPDCGDVDMAFHGLCSNLNRPDVSQTQPWEMAFSAGGPQAIRLFLANFGSEPTTGTVRVTFTPRLTTGTPLFGGQFNLPVGLANYVDLEVPAAGAVMASLTRSGASAAMFVTVTPPQCLDVVAVFAGACGNLSPVDRGVDPLKSLVFHANPGGIRVWMGNPGPELESGSFEVSFLPGPEPAPAAPGAAVPMTPIAPATYLPPLP